ncbi:MAG: pyruvate dehydrogenase (acetyl-transferring) E1 component subunit alpha [Bacillota bacterium]
MSAVTPPLRAKPELHKLLEAMLLIRRFEERCVELYSGVKIRGFLHLYIGEEAVAVGAMAALTSEDAVVSTYREHGHALARGIDGGRIMAELYGKRQGVSGGRGGSMHLFDAAARFYGGHAIVGGGLPVAAGLALADKMLSRPRVTGCFFGEGAVAEGVFHETLNLSVLWKLPVVFFCENNLYAMGTRLERSESQPDVHAKAAGYGAASRVVDGMDILAVRDAAREAVAAARAGGGPQFLELRTYRFRAHSMFDPELYRPKSEVETWKERDPIDLLASRLERDKFLDKEERRAMEARVLSQVQAAVDFAEAGDWEPVSTLSRDVVGSQAGQL